MSPGRILLDTNVLSELMRPRPEPRVLAWFSAQGLHVRFVVSTITQAEILLGIALLPAGKKRSIGNPQGKKWTGCFQVSLNRLFSGFSVSRCW